MKKYTKEEILGKIMDEWHRSNTLIPQFNPERLAEFLAETLSEPEEAENLSLPYGTISAEEVERLVGPVADYCCPKCNLFFPTTFSHEKQLSHINTCQKPTEEKTGLQIEVEGLKNSDLMKEWQGFLDWKSQKSEPTEEKEECNCGKTVQHRGTNNRCCECHVNAGNSPADWHPDCMVAWDNQKEKEVKPETKEEWPKWEAYNDSKVYYYLTATGEIATISGAYEFVRRLQEYENCFRTRAAAEEALEKIKEVLLNLNK